jgi:hypothetical protein
MILILTEPRDVHADHVAHKLRERGAGFRRFHPAEFPRHAELSLSYSATGRARYRLRAGGEAIDLDRVTAVWYRRPRTPVPHEEIADERVRASVEGECQNFVHDVWNSLDCAWLPAPHAVIRRATLKASQLKVAGAVGFELPPTLFTNSPAEFLEFYREHNGHIISKLSGFSVFREADSPFNRFTELVTKRDVGYAHAIRYCPVIFQAYVPKRVELRITVVGREVFAVEIHSQASNHTRHDWRRYDDFKTPRLPHELPGDVEGRCVRLVERLGLCYGAIDMVLTPDGRYVFIEINPNGQYLWLEQATGLPISDAICDLLMSATPADEPARRLAESSTGAPS